MTEPRSLYYFPCDPAEWLARTATLSPLGRAAFADLRMAAWTAEKRGAPACALPDDDAQLARLARLERGEWKKVRAEVRALLTASTAGWLVDSWLLGVWTTQHGAYQKRASAGRDGGNATKEKRRRGSNATGNASSNAASIAGSKPGSNGAANAHQSELEEELVAQPLTGHGLLAPSAPGGALAPADAAPRATGATGPSPALAAQQEARADRERRYFALLRASANTWMAAHREETREIGAAERKLMGFAPPGQPLTPVRERILHEAVIEKIREREGWPTSEDWDEGDVLVSREPAGVS